MRLHGGATHVQELADPDSSLPTTSRHLRVLEDAGLVRRERHGKGYLVRLERGSLYEAIQWITQHHSFWAVKLRALEEFATSAPIERHNESMKKAVIRRVILASCADAYAYFTDPELLIQWFGSGEMVAVVNLRIGGHYKFSFSNDEGTYDALSGKYTHISEGKFLRFTWQWQPATGEKDKESYVTVNFNDHPQGCEVEIIHTDLENDHQLERHSKGWQNTLRRLKVYAERQ